MLTPEQLEKTVLEFGATLGKIEEKVNQRDTEIKSFGTAREETGKELGKLDAKLTELGKELKETAQEIIVKSELMNLEPMKVLQARIDELEKAGKRPGYEGTTEFKSLGTEFIESDVYKNMMAQGTGAKYESSRHIVKDLFDRYNLGFKALTTGAGSAGELIVPRRLTQIYADPTRPLRIRDLLPVERTTQSSLEYIQETGFTDEATSTKEQGAAAPVAEGAAKPEAKITFTQLTSNARTIAHWIAATRQAIEDAPQLRAYVDNRLIYGLYFAEENQLLYGNGISPNLQGILTLGTIQTHLWSAGTGGATPDTKIDAIRRGMTKTKLAQYSSTGIVVHPNDWQDIELTKGDDGHYIWINVIDGGGDSPRLWRLPIVETDAILEGTALVGAFKQAAILWDREDANIRVSESHSDFFTKNMVAILAEERVMFTIFRPEAFCKITFDAAPA